MDEIEKPRHRECERCGRQDEWNEDRHCWSIVVDDGTRHTGNAHCLHEWDINGTFNPLPE